MVHLNLRNGYSVTWRQDSKSWSIPGDILSLVRVFYYNIATNLKNIHLLCCTNQTKEYKLLFLHINSIPRDNNAILYPFHSINQIIYLDPINFSE